MRGATNMLRPLTGIALAICAVGGIGAVASSSQADTYATSAPADAILSTPSPARPSFDLLAGEFVWQPHRAPAGDLFIAVSLSDQLAYVFRDDALIGVTTISTGRAGYETPTGMFTILQKKREHYSNLYDDAPMPFMQRLTWDGIALHGGDVPGYPASHGCIRLPYRFAKLLFGTTGFDTTVVVDYDAAVPPGVAFPDMALVAEMEAAVPAPRTNPPTTTTRHMGRSGERATIPAPGLKSTAELNRAVLANWTR